MKKIIVPLDFSDYSICALEYAIIFANQYKSDIQLVHVIPRKTKPYGNVLKQKKEIAAEQMEDIIKDYKNKLHKKATFDYIVKTGRIYDEIAEQTEAHEDSAIIASTQGESGWSEYFVGSNTYRIIESTNRPVFSIRSCKNLKPPKTIVMPIDITNETREKVPLVVSIAKKFDSTVHVLKVTSSTTEYIHNTLKMYANQVSKYFNEHDIKHENSLIVGNNITTVTIDYAKTVEADLIAIMTEQNRALTNLFLGSYARQMINNAPMPVLSVTPKEVIGRCQVNIKKFE
ncbi:MAG: universal stress protein [Bacteroidales bacterium]